MGHKVLFSSETNTLEYKSRGNVERVLLSGRHDHFSLHAQRKMT